MALRRATTRRQVEHLLARENHHGEQVAATVRAARILLPVPDTVLRLTFSTVSILLDVVRRQYAYYLTATSSSVFVHRAGFWTNRPGQLLYQVPMHDVTVGGPKRGRYSSTLTFRFPGTTKPTTLLVPPTWNTDLDQFVAALRRSGAVLH